MLTNTSNGFKINATLSEPTRLVGGHPDVTFRRLQVLWERQLVNRFALPKIHNHGEFIYCLDHPSALLLVEHHRLSEMHPQLVENTFTLEQNGVSQFLSAVH